MEAEGVNEGFNSRETSKRASFFNFYLSGELAKIKVINGLDGLGPDGLRDVVAIEVVVVIVSILILLVRVIVFVLILGIGRRRSQSRWPRPGSPRRRQRGQAPSERRRRRGGGANGRDWQGCGGGSRIVCLHASASEGIENFRRRQRALLLGRLKLSLELLILNIPEQLFFRPRADPQWSGAGRADESKVRRRRRRRDFRCFRFVCEDEKRRLLKVG